MKQKTLIFGASGLIGKYLYNLFEQRGMPVIGTYNRNPGGNLLHFDLTTSSIDKLSLEGVSHAIICSAITKLDKCKMDEDYSASVNVIGIKRILGELVKRNIIPVFFSSAAVFDGILGNYKEESFRNPTTVYGRQKKEIEDFILECRSNYLIIRPGKVFGLGRGEGVLFTEWLEKYKLGGEILCADDEKLSPTYVGDVARGVVQLLEQNSRGIYHINPAEHYSRLEMAIKFFDYLSIKDAKLKRCSIDDFPFLEKRPKNTYLDASKFINQTGFVFSELCDYCFKIIKEEYSK